MVRSYHHTKKSYAEVSKQPLYMLIFLLPLIFLYEFALYQTKGKIQIKAHDHLVKFFDLADMPPTRGLWLGGILIIAILGIWQIYSGNRWKIEFRYIAFMAVESVLAAVPLLGLGVVFGSMVATATDASIGSLGLFEKLSVSIGAGLYEELVFRMMIIALVHTIACSFFKQSEVVGLFAGVIVSAILFSLYHDLPDAGTLPPISLFFYGVAGVYLGILFVLRGFGITAAAHATYDIVATTLLAVLVA